jgi:hypothetical protein
MPRNVHPSLLVKISISAAAAALAGLTSAMIVRLHLQNKKSLRDVQETDDDHTCTDRAIQALNRLDFDSDRMKDEVNRDIDIIWQAFNKVYLTDSQIRDPSSLTDPQADLIASYYNDVPDKVTTAHWVLHWRHEIIASFKMGYDE